MVTHPRRPTHRGRRCSTLVNVPLSLGHHCQLESRQHIGRHTTYGSCLFWWPINTFFWGLHSATAFLARQVAAGATRSLLIGNTAWKPNVAIKNWQTSYRAVQWHYKLWNDTVPNHTFITTNHQALFIYNRTKITGWFPVLPLKNVLPQWHSGTVRLAQCHWTALWRQLIN